MSVICDLYSVFFLTCIIDDTNWRIPLDAAHLSFLSSTLGAKIRRAGLTSDVVIEFVVKRCQSKVSVATSRTSSRVQVTNLTVDFTISASCSCINTATNACTMLGMISFASHASAATSNIADDVFASVDRYGEESRRVLGLRSASRPSFLTAQKYSKRSASAILKGLS